MLRYRVDTESPIRDTFERAPLLEFAPSSRILTVGDPFRAAISRRESPFDRTDGDLSFRLLTAGSPEEWPRKCYPLECPSIPPLFISLSFFSRLGRVVENSLGGFGRVNSPCSRASTRNCFLVAGGKRTDGVAQCASPSREKSFSACWLLDVAKHSVDVHVGVDVGVSASATRASFLFLSELLPRKSFLCHFYPSSLPLGRFFLPLFAIDRESSSSFAFLPPSSKAFRRV